MKHVTYNTPNELLHDTGLMIHDKLCYQLDFHEQAKKILHHLEL